MGIVVSPTHQCIAHLPRHHDCNRQYKDESLLVLVRHNWLGSGRRHHRHYSPNRQYKDGSPPVLHSCRNGLYQGGSLLDRCNSNNSSSSSSNFLDRMCIHLPHPLSGHYMLNIVPNPCLSYISLNKFNRIHTVSSSTGRNKMAWGSRTMNKVCIRHNAMKYWKTYRKSYSTKHPCQYLRLS